MKQPPRRILVICIRRLGDVLLSTALIRSLKCAWPEAQIDVLVNAGSAVVLHNNPDIHQLQIQPERAGIWQTVVLLWRIWRRYDLAVSTLHNDRPHFYAFVAAPVRACIIPGPNQPRAWVKRYLSRYHTLIQLRQNHAIEQYLQLADALGVPRVPQVVAPRPTNTNALDRLIGVGWEQRRYAVVHPVPMYQYKAWTVAGWQALVNGLTARGLEVFVTGGPGASDRETVAAIFSGLSVPAGVINLVGALQFSELTPLIERAQIFAGPDTSVTHLASATGVPTIALFGPSNPVSWGPWPQHYAGDVRSPWVKQSPTQHQGNVWILQGVKSCVPCLKEGCDRHLNSRADCLDELPAARVLSVVDEIVGPA